MEASRPNCARSEGRERPDHGNWLKARRTGLSEVCEVKSFAWVHGVRLGLGLRVQVKEGALGYDLTRVCEVQGLTSARSISESPPESMGTMACLHTHGQRLCTYDDRMHGLTAGTHTVAAWITCGCRSGGVPVLIVRGDAGRLQAEARHRDPMRLSAHEGDAREREGVDNQVHLGRGGRLQRGVHKRLQLCLSGRSWDLRCVTAAWRHRVNTIVLPG